jgi:hypothetical protein
LACINTSTFALRVHRSQAVGGNGGEPFEDKGEGEAFLTGFGVKIRGTEIAFLQPVYWRPTGKKVVASGIGNPNDAQTHPTVEAKDGYAIGGLKVWANSGGGFQLNNCPAKRQWSAELAEVIDGSLDREARSS